MARVLTMVISAVVLAALAFALVNDGRSSSDTPPAVQAASGQTAPAPAPRPSSPRPANTRRLSPRDLVRELESAGLGVEDAGERPISMDDLSRFPEEPRSTLRIRVSDGKGDSAPMTFVEFGSWKTAAAVDAKPINGFAVRNWFVVGTVNNYMAGLVKAALND